MKGGHRTNKIVNWGSSDHASHAPQLIPCNYYVYMCVCVCVCCAGYRYGKSLIPISDADEQAMKLESERGLSLLGFTNMKNIKWHQVVGNSVQCIAADPSNEVSLVTMCVHNILVPDAKTLASAICV